MSQTYTRQILYDVSWQRLRVSLLGSWGDVSSAEVSLGKIEQYVKEPCNDFGNRVWRALNLLNAVLLSYKGGKNHPCWHTVQNARDVYSVLYRTSPLVVGFESPDYEVWSWEKVREDLKRLPDLDLKTILNNMESRRRTANYHSKRQQVSAPVDQTRPELLQFMTLVSDELHTRSV